MGKEKRIKEDYLLEIEDMRIRLGEAEETLSAIRRGEVDGLVVSGPEGEQVFTLKGAERSYRFFVEAMNEGAVTLSLDGAILYCNDRFSEMVETPCQKIIGDSIYRFVSSPEVFEPAFQKGKGERSKTETFLKRKENEPVPVSVSFNPMQEDQASGVCMVVTDLTDHMRKDDLLKESEQRLRQLSSKLLSAQEEERKRIAGDIHDSLGSSLSHIKMRMEAILEHVGQKGDSEITESLKSILPPIQESIEECRRLQMDLRPAMLDDLGISATLSWFCRRFQATYPRISVEQKITIKEEEMSGSLKTAIFRIIQEAVNNVAKHSNANSLSLFLTSGGKKIELAVADNGRGFRAEEILVQKRAGQGLGLESMRERVELSGGSFAIQSTKGEGTVIRASWPSRP